MMKNQCIFIVYVDDGIIAADEEEQTVKLFLKKHESEFSVVIGEANYFLHIRIEHLERMCTSIEKGAITTDDSVYLSTDVSYREAVGNLMFLAIVTRPEIAYAVGVLSQVLDKLQQIHWIMVKRILRRSTSGIVFKYNEGAIAWRSQQQNCIALSTTEAEFIAASQAAKEAVLCDFCPKSSNG
ncbi:retrovirus-related Pol polyprotein from transposon TNT 1-94 [Trichonephila clavipes]|nr:retrovirus-related Pol polyprotein from transposon TNT 1-94 [Trichonephila clavipes]